MTLLRVSLFSLLAASVGYSQFKPELFFFRAEYDAESEIQDLGESSSRSVQLRASVPLLRQDNALLAASVGYDLEEVEGSLNSGGEFPFDSLETISLGVTGKWDVNDDWTILSINTIRSERDEGVDFGSSIRFSGIYGAWKNYSDTFSIGLGVGVSTRFEDSPSVFPVILLNWEFADKWALTTGPTPGVNMAAGVAVEYRHHEKWNFYAGTRFLSNQFRIEGDEIFEDDRVFCFLTSQYRIDDNLSFSATLGLNLGRTWTFYDREGNNEVEFDKDASAAVSVNLGYQF